MVSRLDGRPFDLLPGLFAKAGLRDVQVWLSDEVVPLMPPYDRPDQLAELTALHRWKEEGSGPFDEAGIRGMSAGGQRGIDRSLIAR